MSSPAERMTIRVVAARSGVPATTLRYYETIGLLPSTPRVSGRRHYAPSVLDRLAVITTARRAGFTLAEIRELLDGMTAGGEAGESWRTMTLRKLPEVDLLIKRLEVVRTLLEAMADCKCPDLPSCAALLRDCDAAPKY